MFTGTAIQTSQRALVDRQRREHAHSDDVVDRQHFVDCADCDNPFDRSDVIQDDNGDYHCAACLDGEAMETELVKHVSGFGREPLYLAAAGALIGWFIVAGGLDELTLWRPQGAELLLTAGLGALWGLVPRSIRAGDYSQAVQDSVAFVRKLRRGTAAAGLIAVIAGLVQLFG